MAKNDGTGINDDNLNDQTEQKQMQDGIKKATDNLTKEKNKDRTAKNKSRKKVTRDEIIKDAKGKKGPTLEDTQKDFSDATGKFSDYAGDYTGKAQTHLDTVKKQTQGEFDPIISHSWYAPGYKSKKEAISKQWQDIQDRQKAQRQKQKDAIKAAREAVKNEKEAFKEGARETLKAKEIGETQKKIDKATEKADEYMNKSIEAEDKEQGLSADIFEQLAKAKGIKASKLRDKIMKKDDTLPSFSKASPETLKQYAEIGKGLADEEKAALDALEADPEYSKEQDNIKAAKKAYWQAKKELTKEQAPYAIRNAFLIIDMIQKSLRNIGRALPQGDLNPAYTKEPLEEPELYKLWRTQIEKQQEFKQQTFEKSMEATLDRLIKQYDYPRELITKYVTDNMDFQNKIRNMELDGAKQEYFTKLQLDLAKMKEDMMLDDNDMTAIMNAAILDEAIRSGDYRKARINMAYVKNPDFYDHVLAYLRLGGSAATTIGSVLDAIEFLPGAGPAVKAIARLLQKFDLSKMEDRDIIAKIYNLGYPIRDLDAGMQFIANLIAGNSEAIKKAQEKNAEKAEQDQQIYLRNNSFEQGADQDGDVTTSATPDIKGPFSEAPIESLKEIPLPHIGADVKADKTLDDIPMPNFLKERYLEKINADNMSRKDVQDMVHWMPNISDEDRDFYEQLMPEIYESLMEEYSKEPDKVISELIKLSDKDYLLESEEVYPMHARAIASEKLYSNLRGPWKNVGFVADDIRLYNKYLKRALSSNDRVERRAWYKKANEIKAKLEDWGINDQKAKELLLLNEYEPLFNLVGENDAVEGAYLDDDDNLWIYWDKAGLSPKVSKEPVEGWQEVNVGQIRRLGTSAMTDMDLFKYDNDLLTTAFGNDEPMPFLRVLAGTYDFNNPEDMFKLTPQQKAQAERDGLLFAQQSENYHPDLERIESAIRHQNKVNEDDANEKARKAAEDKAKRDKERRDMEAKLKKEAEKSRAAEERARKLKEERDKLEQEAQDKADKDRRAKESSEDKDSKSHIGFNLGSGYNTAKTKIMKDVTDSIYERVRQGEDIGDIMKNLKKDVAVMTPETDTFMNELENQLKLQKRLDEIRAHAIQTPDLKNYKKAAEDLGRAVGTSGIKLDKREQRALKDAMKEMRLGNFSEAETYTRKLFNNQVERTLHETQRAIKDSTTRSAFNKNVSKVLGKLGKIANYGADALQLAVDSYANILDWKNTDDFVSQVTDTPSDEFLNVILATVPNQTSKDRLRKYYKGMTPKQILGDILSSDVDPKDETFKDYAKVMNLSQDKSKLIKLIASTTQKGDYIKNGMSDEFISDEDRPLTTDDVYTMLGLSDLKQGNYEEVQKEMRYLYEQPYLYQYLLSDTAKTLEPKERLKWLKKMDANIPSNMK